MGHKTHPTGFRLGTVKDWQARWYAGRAPDYRRTLFEDLRLREAVRRRYPEAGVARVEVERSVQEVTMTIWTARPGIVIGRQGQRVEELRQALETLSDHKVRVLVQEIRQPELEAVLVARSVAEQLERRVAYRRALAQAATRTMQAGAKGVKIIVRGRLGGAEIARREKVMQGQVPLHTIRADIDYAASEARTMMGRIGVKVWIYKGDIYPEGEDGGSPEEMLAPIQVTVRADEVEEESSDAPAEAS